MQQLNIFFPLAIFKIEKKQKPISAFIFRVDLWRSNPFILQCNFHNNFQMLKILSVCGYLTLADSLLEIWRRLLHVIYSSIHSYIYLYTYTFIYLYVHLYIHLTIVTHLYIHISIHLFIHISSNSFIHLLFSYISSHSIIYLAFHPLIYISVWVSLNIFLLIKIYLSLFWFTADKWQLRISVAETI